MKASYNKWVTVECKLKVGQKVTIDGGLKTVKPFKATILDIEYAPKFAGAFKVYITGYNAWISVKWVI